MAAQGSLEKTRGQKKSSVIKSAKIVLKFCLDNWLVLGFGIATLLAYLFPSMQRVPIIGAI